MMVTRGNIKLVRTAYQCFKSQTWRRRELVIICDDVSEELRKLADADKAEVRLFEVPTGLKLGDLRNLAVARSSGEFLCQWDDDDLYDPNRVWAAMQVFSKSDVDAVFLNRWMIYWEQRNLLAISGSRYWEGSIIAKRFVFPVYPSIQKSEDTIVTRWILNKNSIAVLDFPQLYCYRITGENTWGDDHFEMLISKATKVFERHEIANVLSLPCFQHLN